MTSPGAKMPRFPSVLQRAARNLRTCPPTSRRRTVTRADRRRAGQRDTRGAGLRARHERSDADALVVSCATCRTFDSSRTCWCAGCHGDEGKGDGSIATGVDKPPVEFNHAYLVSQSPEELRRKGDASLHRRRADGVALSSAASEGQARALLAAVPRAAGDGSLQTGAARAAPRAHPTVAARGAVRGRDRADARGGGRRCGRRCRGAHRCSFARGGARDRPRQSGVSPAADAGRDAVGRDTWRGDRSTTRADGVARDVRTHARRTRSGEAEAGQRRPGEEGRPPKATLKPDEEGEAEDDTAKKGCTATATREPARALSVAPHRAARVTRTCRAVRRRTRSAWRLRAISPERIVEPGSVSCTSASGSVMLHCSYAERRSLRMQRCGNDAIPLRMELDAPSSACPAR